MRGVGGIFPLDPRPKAEKERQQVFESWKEPSSSRRTLVFPWSRTAPSFGYKTVLITSKDIADARGSNGELVVLGQIDGQALSAEVSFILGLDHSIFDPSGSLARLTMRGFGPVPQIPFPGFAQDVINDGTINAEQPSRLRDVMPVGFKVLKDGLSDGLGVDPAQFLIVYSICRSLDNAELIF